MAKTKASLWVIAATTITVATLFLLPFTPKVAVQLARVQRGDLVQTVMLDGIVCYENEQPLVSLQAGRVSGVYIEKGERVKAGQLLFSMDTTAEEQALAAISQMLYDQERAIGSFAYADALSAAAIESTWEARKTESELKASILSKQIRAQSDGVIGGVYAREGDYVAELAMLGAVRGEGKAIMAVNRTADAMDVCVGACASVRSASGHSLGLAELCIVGAPSVEAQTAQYVQQLTFLPESDILFENLGTGDQVTVEMLTGATENVPLAPISAVGSGNRLWVVRDGKASAVQIDVSKRNEHYVCVPEALAGEQIIVTPDEYELYDGCPVKEGKHS